MRRNLAPLLATLALILSACAEPEPPYGEYALNVVTPDDTQMVFEGAGATCGLNTSYPDGDPDKGKFYVSVTSDNGSTLSLLGSFRDYEETPPAGSYAVSEQVILSASVDNETLETAGGAMALSDEGEGLRVEFTGLSNLNGSLLCLP